MVLWKSTHPSRLIAFFFTLRGLLPNNLNKNIRGKYLLLGWESKYWSCHTEVGKIIINWDLGECNLLKY